MSALIEIEGKKIAPYTYDMKIFKIHPDGGDLEYNFSLNNSSIDIELLGTLLAVSYADDTMLKEFYEKSEMEGGYSFDEETLDTPINELEKPNNILELASEYGIDCSDTSLKLKNLIIKSARITAKNLSEYPRYDDDELSSEDFYPWFKVKVEFTPYPWLDEFGDNFRDETAWTPDLGFGDIL